MRMVRKGNFRLVVDAVAKGANYNAANSRGLTPLMAAALHSTAESRATTQFLLDTRAELEARDEEMMTPLLHACRNCNLDVVLILVGAGASVRAQNSTGRTAPMVAMMEGTKRADTVVQEMVNKSAPLEVRDKQGWSVLHHACQEGRHQLAMWLLKKQANPLDKASDGRTGFVMALAKGDQDMGKLLLQFRANPSEQDFEGNTSLMLALQAEHKEASEWLIREAGIDVQLVNHRGLVARDFALAAGMHGIARLLESMVFNMIVQAGGTNIPKEKTKR